MASEPVPAGTSNLPAFMTLGVFTVYVSFLIWKMSGGGLPGPVARLRFHWQHSRWVKRIAQLRPWQRELYNHHYPLPSQFQVPLSPDERRVWG